MTDAEKIMNPQHFGRDPADIQIWINPNLNPGSHFGIGGVCSLWLLLLILLLIWLDGLPCRQNYRCWCDLRKLEEQVGERFLTHESDDGRWNQYRKDHSLPDWPLYGHTDITEDDRFNFNKSPIMPPSPS